MVPYYTKQKNIYAKFMRIPLFILQKLDRGIIINVTLSMKTPEHWSMTCPRDMKNCLGSSEDIILKGKNRKERLDQVKYYRQFDFLRIPGTRRTSVFWCFHGYKKSTVGAGLQKLQWFRRLWRVCPIKNLIWKWSQRTCTRLLNQWSNLKLTS